jgi:hypothetical protein
LPSPSGANFGAAHYAIERQEGLTIMNGNTRGVGRRWPPSNFVISGMKVLSSLMLLLAVVLPVSLIGQTLTGRVAESTGAVLPKACVVVHNQATNVEVVTATAGISGYTVPYLKPGIYSVTASFPSFSIEARTDITLQVSQTVIINLVHLRSCRSG